MKHVRLRISAGGREGEIHPMYDVLANAPYVEYATALQWNVMGEELGILHYVEGEIDAFAEAAESIPEVVAYELERVGDDAFYAYIRDAMTEPLLELFGATAWTGIVTVPPIEYERDGAVSFSMFGPSAEVQDAIEAVPDPVTVTVEEVTGLRSIPRAVDAKLTDRQRAAVEAAVDAGYYDVPRTATGSDVADRLGCAPSTAAEHLRKAESKLLRGLYG